MKGALEIPKSSEEIRHQYRLRTFRKQRYLTVIVVESERAEAVDSSISESGLSQWNKVKVFPSLTLEDGIKDIQGTKAIF